MSLIAARERSAPIPEPTPSLEQPTKLCVGIATFDDFDGAWFTLASVVLYHPEILDQVSFVVVDNHPEGRYAAALKALESQFPRTRYIPFRQYRSTTARDLVFRHAQAEIVLCLDSHVLVAPGGLAALIDYFDRRPGSRDMVQGPLIRSPHLATGRSALMLPQWRDGRFGTWSRDGGEDSGPADQPYPIQMQGLGLFAFRKQAWPGFNPRLRGFGVEEGYLHERARRNGGETVALPALQWWHRFERPDGVPHRVLQADINRNYELMWRELGWDLDELHGALLEGTTREHIDTAIMQASNPFARFDTVVGINLDTRAQRWEWLTAQGDFLGFAWLLERRSAVATPLNHHIGCAASWRAVIADAQLRGLESVVVLEDDVIFRTDTLDHLATLTHELDEWGEPWDLLYLGVSPASRHGVAIPGVASFERATRPMTTHAVVVHARAFRRILETVPEDLDELAGWIDENLAIDQWFGRATRDGELISLVARPNLATQREHLPGWIEVGADVSGYITAADLQSAREGAPAEAERRHRHRRGDRAAPPTCGPPPQLP